MKSLLTEFRSAINQWGEAFRDDTVFVEYAQFSYERCADWFGAPPDPEWPYTVIQGSYTGCQRNRLLKSYYIFLHPQFIGTQNRLELLGHEMYHRVTWKRPGLTRTIWVDEMLAIRASLHLLRAKGYVNLPNKIEEQNRRSSAKLPIDRFQTILPKHRILGIPRRQYPAGFVPTAICLGAALDSLVGWKGMCRLVGSLTWDDWLHTLPDNRRSPVLFLLGSLSTVSPDLSFPYSIEEATRNLDAKTRVAFGIALFYFGNYVEACLQCRIAAEQDPTYGTPYSHLGHIYADQGQNEEAIYAYREAVKREPNSVTDHSNLGLLLEQMDQKEEALLELQIAAGLKPDSPKIRYQLACALYGVGRQADAAREWQWVAGQEDPIAASARTRISELGFPTRQF